MGIADSSALTLMDDTVSADDTTSEDVPAHRSSPRTVPVVAFVLAVLVAGILGVLAVVALSVDDSDGGSDADDARSAAGEYAERFLALDADGFDRWLDDMRSIGTAGFGESVGRRAEELRTIVTQTQVTWTGTAVDVFATSVDDGVVSTVVLYDLRVTDQQGTRTIPDQYMRVDLVEGTDGWLVERVIPITGSTAAVGAGTDPDTPAGTDGSTTTQVGG